MCGSTSVTSLCSTTGSSKVSPSRSVRKKSAQTVTKTATTSPTTKTSSSSSKSNDKNYNIQDIEDLHIQALQSQSKTYIDPETGFTVFTEYAHLKRGKCCGNVCRHCPYGWENVSYRRQKNNTTIRRRQPKVRSGDAEGVQSLVEKIESGNVFYSCDEKEEEDTDNEEDDDDDDDDDEREEQQQEQILLLREKEISPIHKLNENQESKGGRHGGRYTTKNVPYTRSGDKGTSVLLTGERRTKDDDAFEAMGTVDELCSVVGVAHAELSRIDSQICQPSGNNNDSGVVDYGELNDWLLDIMSRLFDLGSHVAKPRKKNVEEDNDDTDDDDNDDDDTLFEADGVGGGFDKEHIDILEDWIDILTEVLPELTSFVLPTGGPASAQLHVARCVCRRAERRVLPLVRQGICDPNALQYLNRLSDFLFTAARWTNYCEGREEIQYMRHFRGAKQRGRVTISLRDEKKKDF